MALLEMGGYKGAAHKEALEEHGKAAGSTEQEKKKAEETLKRCVESDKRTKQQEEMKEQPLKKQVNTRPSQQEEIKSSAHTCMSPRGRMRSEGDAIEQQEERKDSGAAEPKQPLKKSASADTHNTRYRCVLM